jgi:tRNA pseudouridine38-40 synthase
MRDRQRPQVKLNVLKGAMKVAMLIEYDGTDFSGWQVQENGRSVQGEIEKGLRQLFGREIGVVGAGRTDAGVHARGMVAHAVLPEDAAMTIQKLTMAMNATTPRDIAIRDIREVPDDFNARHSARARQYRYTIKTERTALDRRYVWALRGTIDTDKLRVAASHLTGEFDFTSFSKRTNDVDHYRCIVEHCEWVFRGTSFALTIRANRFVRGMVRALVGAMVEVGQDDLTLADFETLLKHPRELNRAKYIAPAHGLVLEGVAYPERFGLWDIGREIVRT